MHLRSGLTLLAATAALAPTSSAAAATAAKVVTINDNEKTVTLVKGQRLRVRLPVCDGCRNNWKLKHAPDRHVLRRQSQLRSGSGANAVIVFRYVARASGRTSLEIDEVPPGARRPEQVFRLKVQVR